MMYTPRFLTETKEPIWNDCVWRSTVMALDKWSIGRLFDKDATPQSLIRLSERLRDEVDPTNIGGASLVDASLAVSRMWLGLAVHDYDEPASRLRDENDFKAVLWDGSGLVILGDELDFPRYLRRWTTNDDFKHSVYIQGLRTIEKAHAHGAYQCKAGVEHTFIMDPLGRGGYKGEWFPVEEIMRFVWRLSDDSFYAAVYPEGEVSKKIPPYFAEGEQDVIVADGLGATSSKLLRLPAGAKVFQFPGGPAIRTLPSSDTFPYFGFPKGERDWAVIGIRYDGQDVLAYARRAAGTIVDAPVPPRPDLEARIVELEKKVGIAKGWGATIKDLGTELLAL